MTGEDRAETLAVAQQQGDSLHLERAGERFENLWTASARCPWETWRRRERISLPRLRLCNWCCWLSDCQLRSEMSMPSSSERPRPSSGCIGWKRQVNGAAASLRSVRSRRSPRRRPASVGAPGRAAPDTRRKAAAVRQAHGRTADDTPAARRPGSRGPVRPSRNTGPNSSAKRSRGRAFLRGSGLSASADDERENSNMRPPHSNRLALAFSVCGRLGIAPMPGKLSTGMIALPGSPYGYCTQTSIRDVALT